MSTPTIYLYMISLYFKSEMVPSSPSTLLSNSHPFPVSLSLHLSIHMLLTSMQRYGSKVISHYLNIYIYTRQKQ